MRQALHSDAAAADDVASSPAAAVHSTIEPHLRELNRLFDPLAASPLNEKDLAQNFEAYIVDGGKEFPSGMPDALIIHLERPSESAEAESAARKMQFVYACRAALPSCGANGCCFQGTRIAIERTESGHP